MKTKASISILMISIMLSAFSGFTQEKGPKKDKSITSFARCMGSWHSTVNMTSGKSVQVVDYTIVFSSIADGYGVYMEETAKSAEMGTYLCSNMVGYDPYEKKPHWYSVDNMGTAHDHSFTWKKPDHLVILHNSVRSGKKYSENIDLTFTGDNSMVLKYIEKLDGKVAVKSEGTFERATK